MTAVYYKELKSFFSGMTGYVFAAFVLLFAGIYVMAINLDSAYPNFEYVLSSMSFIFLIIIPVLTMRAIAEERRQKTDKLLYALPLSMTKVVMGKYFAMLTVMLIPMAVMGFYPLILSAFGSVWLPTAYGCLLGFFLLGAALIAMGLFISSVTENQAIAAVLCFILLLVNYFISDLAGYISTGAQASFMALCLCVILLGVIFWLLTHNPYAGIGLAFILEMGLCILFYFKSTVFEGLFPKVMEQLSVFDRFYAFIDGVFDLTAIIYFITVIAVFLFLSVQSLEKRRWS